MNEFRGNAVTWFELPTRDFARATNFYETLLDTKLIAYNNSDTYAMFPAEDGKIGGAIVKRPDQDSCNNGALVYLNVDGRLEATLDRAKKLNATILVPRTPVPGSSNSFYAWLMDSEGNRIGLHSSNA